MSLSDRQRQIIDASVELIAQRGIQGLTMKSLAAQIGISEPAIYRHFPSKTEILMAILDFFHEETESIFAQAGRGAPSSLDLLSAFLAANLDRLAQAPAVSAVVFSEDIFRNEARLSDRVVEIMQKNGRRFQAIIEKGARKGELRADVPPEQMAQIVMGALRLLVTRWRMSGFAFDLKAEGARLWSSLRKLLARE